MGGAISIVKQPPFLMELYATWLMFYSFMLRLTMFDIYQHLTFTVFILLA